MQFQFDIGSTSKPAPIQPQLPPVEMVPHLLNQILESQREQLGQILQVQLEHLQHVRAMAHDQVARWRNVLPRWAEEHPELAETCKNAYPLLEKAYVKLLISVVEDLAEQGEDALDNEFAVQEFIDRYGMRIGQFSHLLGIIGPMSEAAQQNEAAKQQALEAAKQQQQQPQAPPG
jgi:hypothetical protein